MAPMPMAPGLDVDLSEGVDLLLGMVPNIGDVDLLLGMVPNIGDVDPLLGDVDPDRDTVSK